jgi:hypothetical protein
LVRNLFEASVARQARRVVDIDDPTDEQLVTLLPLDLPEAVGADAAAEVAGADAAPEVTGDDDTPPLASTP